MMMVRCILKFTYNIFMRPTLDFYVHFYCDVKPT